MVKFAGRRNPRELPTSRHPGSVSFTPCTEAHYPSRFAPFQSLYWFKLSIGTTLTGGPSIPSESESGVDVDNAIVFTEDYDVKINNFLGFAIISFIILIGFIVLYRGNGLVYDAIFIFGLLYVIFTCSIFTYQIFQQNRSVTLSPDGLRDSNIMTEFVPWSAVNEVSSRWSYFKGTKYPMSIHLGLKQGTGRILKLNWRGRHFFLKKDELEIAFGSGMMALGTRMDPERFSEMVKAYVRAYGHGVK
jgi:hypothetical protein